jgi:regulator of RNase E activity RraA
VFSSGTSTLGSNGYAKVISCGQALTMAESSHWPVVVNSGDIVMADIHGVVCCPAELLTQVASLCLERTFADEKVMMDIKNGATLAESFKHHRK